MAPLQPRLGINFPQIRLAETSNFAIKLEIDYLSDLNARRMGSTSIAKALVNLHAFTDQIGIYSVASRLFIG